MDWLQALLLGLIQGLTEFLPVSSSGHLELSKVVAGIESADSLTFTIAVHGATVLSTIVVFRRDIGRLLQGLFQFKWNEETRYVVLLLFSALPVLIIGIFFREKVEQFFTGRIIFVGAMLLVTALLLTFSYYSKNHKRPVGFASALVIGIAQALAVLPGISRSGATISTALMLGREREEAARFSFLMVLVPIIGANLLDLLEHDFSAAGSIAPIPLIIGVVTAFVAGVFACSWMIKLVTRGKLIYFAIYCLIIGLTAISFGVLG